jgi:hypothetical protein
MTAVLTNERHKGPHSGYLLGFSAYVTRVGERTKEADQIYLDAENRRMNIKLAHASKGSGYPGPKEAANAMLLLERMRYNRTKKRLIAQEMQYKLIDVETKRALDRLASLFRRGSTVDCWFNYGLYNMGLQSREYTSFDGDMERRYLENDRNRLACYKDTVKSDYSMEARAEGWIRHMKKMWLFYRHPLSAWTKEYMKEVAPLRPLRKAPPYLYKPAIDRVGDEAKRKLHSCLVQTIYL